MTLKSSAAAAEYIAMWAETRRCSPATARHWVSFPGMNDELIAEGAMTTSCKPM
jgi:hypothetical protein